ncbi:HlyD family type I secretion periplasmic adaptor subunit [Sinorhizobium americanum]|uniref:Membrane fusion protein (MFP) family protein n=1 Tax=Sinorhizobium americanum TaxID=194963 RepID=A0A1L3LV69_9HYPH|nr:HlyD family type I secretion periplasmic adaptor subunit [Sinorhizobium americanum]APG93946.1 hemolysin secretion protein D [Sinorhizobium americanum]OAP34055.1 hemolysin secretion protein D [Sinorhizobium americanum]
MITEPIVPMRPSAQQLAKTDDPDRRLPMSFPVAQPAGAVDAELIEDDANSSLRRLVIAGLATILVAFGGFFGWAFSTELSSASVTNGTVIVDTKRRTVSHFEGGVLSRVLVQEGDHVVAEQPLVKLEDTRARSDLQALQSRRVGLIAKLARLKTEQMGATAISFPADLANAETVTADDAVTAETSFFMKRREAKSGRLEIQRKTIEEYSEKAKSLATQIQATDRQIELIKEQRSAIATLVDKAFAQRSKLIEIDARLSELAASRGELVGDRAQAEKAGSGAELALTGIESDFQSEIAGEITTARLELADVEERITAAKDVLRRLEIRAPQAGVVANIQLRTPGSAVTPGQPLLDIVPEDEPLLIEMRVSTRDIDSIAIGSKTRIRLTAYNQRSHLPLDGTVTYVAADQSVDEKSNFAYFVARAEIASQSLAANPDIRLYPGMPAEVLIVHKPRSVIDYLVSPVSNSLNRAFRED